MASEVKPMLVSTARVQVTIEVDARSSWDPTCTVDQIHQQAATETLRGLEIVFAKNGIRVVGKPNVLVITSERK